MNPPDRPNTSSTDRQSFTTEPTWRGFSLRGLALVAGLIVPQFILYGPSLIGNRVLLPLDILQTSGRYLPTMPEDRAFRPHNHTRSDLVLAIEFRRRFAVSEVRAGRLPLWNPYNYCGAPFIAANNTAVFSPFRLIDYVMNSPVSIAWSQLVKAVFIGIGAYLFFRRAAGVGFWPAVVGAWCTPLIGFFVLWCGYPPSFVVAWTPWLLLATDAAVRRPLGWGGPAVALLTAAVMVSGHAATAAHVLLVSGLYFLWCLVNQYGWRGLLSFRSAGSIVVTVAAWGLGMLLSSVQNVPTMEYLETSSRVAKRMEGRVEIPPFGPLALTRLVLPNSGGSREDGSMMWPVKGANRPESAASGYAGLVMTLCFAPLAWCSRRHRGWSYFWLACAILGVSQNLGIPGAAQFYGLFPFRLLKNNRFVFLTAFSTLSLAVVGLDVVRRTERVWRWWCWLAVAAVAALGIWSAGELAHPPPVPTDSQLIAGREIVHDWFFQVHLYGIVLCSFALCVFAVLYLNVRREPWMKALVVGVILGEMLWFAYGIDAQCEWDLYYPPVPALEKIRDSKPGRICGINCLPACLNQTHDLRDIRGYDGTDPARLVDLLEIARNRRVQQSPRYAITQWLVPVIDSPILRLLNVRYLVYRQPPPRDEKVLFKGRSYWVTEIENTLERVFVPQNVEVIEDSDQTLSRLARIDFDPANVAFVDRPVDLPEGPATGSARIVAEVPCEIEVEVDMKTPGLLVLSDLWYEGWKATLNGESVPVVRVDHALKGAVLPEGKGTLVFRYEPQSFKRGLQLTEGGGGILFIWGLAVWWLSRRRGDRVDEAGFAAITSFDDTGREIESKSAGKSDRQGKPRRKRRKATRKRQ